MSNNIDKLVADIVSTGLAWYCNHAEHIHEMVECAPQDIRPFMPSLEDAQRPELWKAGSWIWWFHVTSNAVGHLEDYYDE